MTGSHFSMILSKIKRVLSGGVKSSLCINSLNIKDLQPVKSVRKISQFSKAGRLTQKGTLGNRPIKLYEAENSEHARFIRHVSNCETLKNFFPDIVALSGRFIIAEWVVNKIVKPDLEVICDIQVEIHKTFIKMLPISGYDYWANYIKPRFLRVVDIIDEPELVNDIISEIDKEWYGPAQFLMHPDVTIANIVCIKDGIWQIIDNELLTTGGVPLLDVCNTTYSMSPPDAQKYFELYAVRQGISISDINKRVLNGMWLARICGSEFAAGNLTKAKEFINRYKENGNIIPFNI